MSILKPAALAMAFAYVYLTGKRDGQKEVEDVVNKKFTLVTVVKNDQGGYNVNATTSPKCDHTVDEFATAMDGVVSNGVSFKELLAQHRARA